MEQHWMVLYSPPCVPLIFHLFLFYFKVFPSYFLLSIEYYLAITSPTVILLTYLLIVFLCFSNAACYLYLLYLFFIQIFLLTYPVNPSFFLLNKPPLSIPHCYYVSPYFITVDLTQTVPTLFCSQCLEFRFPVCVPKVIV